MRFSRSTAPRPALFTTKRASISVARVAAGVHEEAVGERARCFDAAIAHQCAAGVFHVALQARACRDAGRRCRWSGKTGRPCCATSGSSLLGFGAGDHAHAFDVVGVRALQQMQQHLLFFVAVGDDQLAAVVVIHAARLAVGVQRAVAGDAEARLETARRVVQAGVNHAAVARRGDGARDGFRLRAAVLRDRPAPARARRRVPRRPRR